MPARVAVAFLLAFVAACGAPAPRARSAKPRIEPLAPADLLPNDLDFVVRIDSRRVKEEPAFDGAARQLAKAGSSSMFSSMLPMIEQSRAVFVGGRVMGDGFQGDGVAAIEPSSSNGDRVGVGVDPSFRSIGRARERMEIFERANAARDEAALEVVFDGGGVVLATAAEVDAVLRVVRTGPDVDRLDPPARGLASFAGRMTARGTATATTTTTTTATASSTATATTTATATATASSTAAGSSTIRLLARGLVRYAGSIDGGDAVHVETELFYASEDDAARAASVVRSLVGRLGQEDGPLRSLADSVKLARDIDVVRLRAAVPFAVLGYLH